MPNLFGSGPAQVPTNGDLGTLAFQDANAVKITGGEVTAVQKTDTAISETMPSLNLDFANTKSLDPRITFTRNTTATFYDGKTMAKAEQNLMLYSEQFDNAGGWTALRASVIGNAAIAPDGSTTADYLSQLTGQTTSGAVYTADASFQALPYVFSVYAKPNGKNFIRVASTVATGSLAGCYFNVSTGAVGTADVGIVGSISAAANGYYRCIIAFTADAARTGSNRIFVADADNSSTVTDSGGVFIWGAQLEQRSAVSSYTPTTSSPVTNYIPALQTAPANSARFDHDPITGESKGLLIEEQRTNLYLYSADLNQSGTSATRSTNYPTSTVAPDGSLTGNLLVEDTSASTTHYYYKSFSATSGTSYTISCYIKAKERSIGYIQFFTTSSVFAAGTAYFDLSNVTVVISGTITSSSITPVGNGWYRVSATQSAAATATGVYGIGLTNSTASTSYTGNGISGMYFWGAQLEAGAFPTSYIPTTTAQVTRSADAASITGTNFSSWYRQDEGTVYAEYTYSADGSIIYQATDDAGNNFIRLRPLGNQHQTFYLSNGVNYAQIYDQGGLNLKTAKTATTYKVNDFAVMTNAGNIGPYNTDGSGLLPVSLTKLIIGSNTVGTSVINGTIKKLTYFPKRLSNDELVEMTS